MTPDGWRVADSDMHIFEPPDLWQRYIDPAWRHAAPGRADRAAARHARQGEVARHAAARHACARGATGDVAWKAEQESVVRGRRGARLGRRRRNARRWTPRASTSRCSSRAAGSSCSGSTPPQVMGTDGLEPEFAAAIARALQRLAARLLQRAPDAPVRRRAWSRRTTSTRPSRRRAAASTELGFKADLPVARAASDAGRGTTRTTIRCGPSASASTSRSLPRRRPELPASPTSRSRSSTR